jgi:hypothetical protein
VENDDIIVNPYGFGMLTEPHRFDRLFARRVPIGQEEDLEALHDDYWLRMRR